VAENNTPISKTIPHTILKRIDCRFVSQLKQPQTTYAAARGAVIVLVMPAANKPNERKYFEN
jgi:hypothetical protein